MNCAGLACNITVPEMSTLSDKEENGMCDIKPALHPHSGYEFKPSVKIKGLYCGG